MWKIEVVSMAIGLCFLVVCTWLDIKKREIPILLLTAGSVLSIVSFLCSGWDNWYLHLTGVGAGGLFLLVSKVTKEAIGYGDGWLICIMGMFLGIWELLKILTAAWILLSVAAMVCLVKKKWSRKAALPMAPFLTAGYVLLLTVGCVE